MMQFSAIICVLFAGALFSATALALTAVQSPAATAARVAVPQVRKPASPRTATDVKNSIVNWDTPVKTVNDYLNNPENKTKLAPAIVFTKDETLQLATLMAVAALPKTGANAGTV
ncbi:hypothetical protein BGZ57DRAFT_910758 [Hyaloscypha finlandica]|nr:hypothetical protein BGZ57DRAFT_910758 [Hyaloscypha finlandica]